MQLYSTRNTSLRFSLEEAVMKGLPADNGLFMPLEVPKMPATFFSNIENHTFPELSFEVAKALIGDSIPIPALEQIVFNAINFPAPIVSLDERTFILELFHGPSLAFKDFGARFMAQLMGYFNRNADKELTILVATSGDTGGAVAAGFLGAPGVRVIILYPSGKVSFLQEQQLTTLGNNITALEIQGSFDDCQALVKEAFLDPELNQLYRFSSANSINIARLIPQSFYYFEAYRQLPNKDIPFVFSVPSGNFGNLTAGLFAKRMGLPVQHFIAATNLNDIVPDYLSSGIYTPKPSVSTLSNAMDVGNPSNFNRILDLYGSTWNNIKSDVIGFAFDDIHTENIMRNIFESKAYILDPHGAVGLLGLNAYKKLHPNTQGIVLETAHPAKFLPDVERILKRSIPVPEKLVALEHLEKKSTLLSPQFIDFKDWLIHDAR